MAISLKTKIMKNLLCDANCSILGGQYSGTIFTKDDLDNILGLGSTKFKKVKHIAHRKFFRQVVQTDLYEFILGVTTGLLPHLSDKILHFIFKNKT